MKKMYYDKRLTKTTSRSINYYFNESGQVLICGV